MDTDYTSFLNVSDDGEIWWPFEIAAKLAAGYLPNGTELREPTQSVRANALEILSDARSNARGNSLRGVEPLPMIERDDSFHVRAREFLSWLSHYVSVTQSNIIFPSELAQAVCGALASHSPPADSPAPFESVVSALEGWFDKPLSKLPRAKLKLLKLHYPMYPLWKQLDPAQRLNLAEQRDYQNDPAKREERQWCFNLVADQNDIRSKIRERDITATNSHADIDSRDRALADLRAQLAQIEAQLGASDAQKEESAANVTDMSECSAPLNDLLVGKEEATEFAAAGEKSPKAKATRPRLDALSFDIESAVRELGSHTTPRSVMGVLQTHIGKPGVSVKEVASDGVYWNDTEGTRHHLTMKNLGSRLSRRAEKIRLRDSVVPR